MNQQETEQFAALRMHVAHLHNALGIALAVLHPDTAEAKVAEAALALSEPELQALLLAIGSDDQVLSKLQSEVVNAAVASVRSHRDELERTRIHGETIAAHVNQQLQAQSRNFGTLTDAARLVVAAKTAAAKHPEGPQPAEWLALCKAIDGLAGVVPG